MSPVPVWHVRGRVLALDRPLIMGILNLTPDSFSDGGRLFSSPDDVVHHVGMMISEGADIIDVGGESTRPGATAVPASEELRRVVPVIEQIAENHPDTVLSIDTVKSAVATAAIDAGVHIVNDVSGLRLDPAIGPLCAATGAGLVLMHSRGEVSDMGSYVHANYGDVVTEVLQELQGQLNLALTSGVASDRIVLDPGIGFGKKSEHSVAVLAALPRLVELGYPVLVGVSRKRFIGETTSTREPSGRLSGTLGANVAALALGARIFRVHDVRPAREALDVAWRILGGGRTS